LFLFALSGVEAQLTFCVATNVSVPQPIPQRKSRRRTLSSSASTRPTFASQYETDSALLGEGAYGSVFKCTHRITELDYAVKIIKKLGQSARKVSTSLFFVPFLNYEVAKN
jgi:hypothetical protein